MARSDGTANALTIVRVLQILTLIPCWAILAALVNIFSPKNVTTPAGVLCLFIVSLLASIWVVCVLITQLRARNTAIWMALGDVVIIAGLITGVVLISNITSWCISGYLPQTAVSRTDDGVKVYTSGSTNTNGDSVWNGNNNHCDLAKAALGLGVTNIILFFISSILVVIVMMQNKREDEEEISRENVYTRRGSAQYARRPRSHRRHRHRYRDPSTGDYIVEEKIV